MNLGRISINPCVNQPPVADPRCSDPAFSLSNPTICPPQPSLIIKPGIALTCALGSIQFKAFYVVNGVETDVTSATIFTSSDLGIAMVGASSGNATGLSAGLATITATYQGLAANAELNILGGSHCCDSNAVAMELVVDTSRSMSQAFGGSYPTRLDFAEAAATRFINEVNSQKDLVGLMRFNAVDDVILASPTSNKASVAALVPGINQTQQVTAFFDALTTAVSELNNTTAPIKVIVLMSDGEDTTASYGSTNNPISLLNDFKNNGGIVICLGCRASGKGFNFLSALATGGFFINGYPGTNQSALDTLSGIKGYICAGNCTPVGDQIVATGQLDYSGFINWDVLGGNVDLIGNGFFDFLPGNGLYVDMAGTIAPKGLMQSKALFALKNGHTYRLTAQLAGNQRLNATPESVELRVYSASNTLLDQKVTINDFTQGFQTYSFNFTPVADASVHVSVQQADSPATGDPRIGLFLGSVTLYDTTDLVTLISDNFDGENLLYVPPRCGAGTTYIPLSGQNLVQVADYKIDAYIEYGPFAPTTIFTPPANGTYVVKITQKSPSSSFYPPNSPQYIRSTISYTDQTNTPQTVQPAADLHMSTASDTGSSTILVKANTPIILNLPVNAAGDTLNGPFEVEAIVYQSLVGYGYAYGYNCYGVGCLTTPPGVQLSDPNPLPDIESGFTPPKQYTSTKTVCASCGAGTQNFGATSLVPVMTSDIAPSGVASASTQSASAYLAFDGNTAFSATNKWQSDVTTLPEWIQYQFPAAQVVTQYGLAEWKSYASPRDFTLAGSNDGITWTTLDTRTGLNWFPNGEVKLFQFTNTTAYLYYRLTVTAANWDSVNPHVVAIAELQLFAAPPAQQCATATATSTQSQANADALANAAALLAAQALLNCRTVFTSTQQYTASCTGPGGCFGPDVTKSATATSFNSQAEADAVALAAAKAAALAALVCTSSNNTAPITINDNAAATPYPSSKYVSGLVGLITSVIVNIKGLTHTFPDDIIMVLRGPGGQTCLLMGNCGGSFAVSNITLKLYDAAASSLPDNALILAPNTNGDFKPTGYAPFAPLPAPGPAQAWGTTLSVFNGTNPNGCWSLWLLDDSAANVGNIALGWDLTIVSA